MVPDVMVGLMTASDDCARILAEEQTRCDGTLLTILTTVPVRLEAALAANVARFLANRPMNSRIVVIQWGNDHPSFTIDIFQFERKIKLKRRPGYRK